MIAEVIFIASNDLMALRQAAGLEPIDSIYEDETHKWHMSGVLRSSSMSGPWSVDVLLEGTESSSTCTLVMDGGHRVIVDTGLSHQEDALVAALTCRGLRPADVDIVINTHLHVDHCGNNSIFPNAVVLMSQREWKWTEAFYAAIFSSAAPESVMPEFYPEIASHGLKARTIRNLASLARTFWDPVRLGRDQQRRWLERSALPDGLELLETPGHTPHHVSIRVASDNPVIVAGDAVLAEAENGTIRTMVPFSRAQFAETRRALLSHGHRIVPGHGPSFSPAIQPGATPRAARTFPP
jgi:glyoxylase-like metal-dependent hydrolase (beta-lactamase superfamily II)